MGNEFIMLGDQPSLPLRADAITSFVAASALEIELAQLDQTGEYLAQPVQSQSILTIPAVVDSAANAADATSLLIFLTRTFPQLLQERLYLLSRLGRRRQVGLDHRTIMA